MKYRKFVFFQKLSDDYIQQSIYKALKCEIDDYRVMFSFEHHKDGVLHSHMIIQHKINDEYSYLYIVNYRYEL